MAEQQMRRQPLWCRLVKRFLYIFVNLLYRVEYQGFEHVPKHGPLILVANHTHWADVFAIHCSIKPWVSWVGKQELFDLPLLGCLLRGLSGIPVNRDKADLASARGIISALRRDEIIGMFPQGTRVKTEQLQQVRPRSGAVHFALKTDSPLLPVAVGGQFRLFRRVRIVFGPVFKLEKPSGQKAEARDLEDVSILVMQRIYSLVDQPYTLAEQARKTEANTQILIRLADQSDQPADSARSRSGNEGNR